MKVAIPLETALENTNMATTFGRAAYFAVYNTESKEVEFIDNSAVAEQGGAGIKAAQVLVDNAVGAVVVPQCGQNAANVLKAAGIVIYQGKAGSFEEAKNAFTNGELATLDSFHAGFHKHG